MVCKLRRGGGAQVVYFHNSQYERIARIPFGRVSEGDPLHVLPALRQLYPEVDLVYEEERVDLAAGPGRWLWLALPGRIYLVAPDARVYHSANVTALLRIYVEASGAAVAPATAAAEQCGASGGGRGV